MTVNERFLEALGAALNSESVGWDQNIGSEEWGELFQLAQAHHVLPMVLEAVYRCPAFRRADPELLAFSRRQVAQAVMLQAMKSAEFLRLYTQLRQGGLKPLVVKGIVCRSLYPQPDERTSSDEDVWIGPEQFNDCHTLFLAQGLAVANPSADIREDYEVPYVKKGSPLYIELHRHLFPPESEVYGSFGQFFSNARDRAVEMEIQGVKIWTMDHTDHLFYLICHAFKHFLHSGFGIRQVCDIVCFANTFGDRIDWRQVLDHCKTIRADKFSAALFAIGRAYLHFDEKKACYPAYWRDIEVDFHALLEDLLGGGVYGDSSLSRRHSSTITLNAAAAQAKGEKVNGSLMKSLFPPVKDLEGRYPYLKEKPWLLPVAWTERIVRYSKETTAGKDNNAVDSVRIGKARLALMRQYGVLEE